MKTFLFYDTETTGLAKMNLPPEHPSQPRVVQIAAIVSDEDGMELACLNEYIIPVGFTIPDEAAAIHGTDTEKATKLGKDAKKVMSEFVILAANTAVHVAHNIAYDRIVVRHECFIQELKMPDKKEMCTMLSMTKKCNLPGRFGKPKWPKLQEAYKWCFNKEFDKAHDALADIRACKDVFFHSVYHRPKGAIEKHYMEGKPIPNLPPFEVVEIVTKYELLKE
jgi:DNA polymerase III subunit epsilon